MEEEFENTKGAIILIYLSYFQVVVKPKNDKIS
jgi:hypothetical protein